MKVFGLPIPFTGQKQALSGLGGTRRGWLPIIGESFAGAWQQNVEVDKGLAMSYHAVYSCVTLIATDIAKLRVKLVERDENGIWSEIVNPAYSPVLRKPNRFQNRIQFFESWMFSKLIRGNTYVLKVRDARGVVNALYVLNPDLVQPLVTDDGDVYYRLSADNLSGIMDDVIVPAREIIHDRMNCIYHPLIGVSPIWASGLAAIQGIRIQNNSASFFGNRSMPSGILTAPGAISDDTAKRLKDHWESNYSGINAGKVAALGDGLKFEPITMSPVDAQLIEQLKWSAEVVCSTFHVPTYKIGIGQLPTYNNIQALNIEYYAQCLQTHIESIELCLDEGLNVEEGIGTEFDTEDLLRMDTATQMDVLEKGKGKLTINEMRWKLGQPPVEGGDTIYLQQQDHSLAAIGARDNLLINPREAEDHDVQSEALNGAQITALQGLVVAASAGEIPLDTIEAVIAAAFPGLTDAEVQAIVAPLKANPPAPVNAPTESDDENMQRFIAALEVRGVGRFEYA